MFAVEGSDGIRAQLGGTGMSIDIGKSCPLAQVRATARIAISLFGIVRGKVAQEGAYITKDGVHHSSPRTCRSTPFIAADRSLSEGTAGPSTPSSAKRPLSLRITMASPVSSMMTMSLGWMPYFSRMARGTIQPISYGYF